MPTNRCSKLVRDSETYRMRKCKNKISYHFSFLNLCTCHIMFNQRINVTKIQATWRSYKVRSKIQKIVIKLPPEIIKIIIKFIRIDWHIEYHYIPSIINIYYKRIDYYERLIHDYRRYTNIRLPFSDLHIFHRQQLKYNIKMFKLFVDIDDWDYYTKEYLL